jgi:hypothetical protein
MKGSHQALLVISHPRLANTVKLIRLLRDSPHVLNSIHPLQCDHLFSNYTRILQLINLLLHLLVEIHRLAIIMGITL